MKRKFYGYLPLIDNSFTLYKRIKSKFGRDIYSVRRGRAASTLKNNNWSISLSSKLGFHKTNSKMFE